jgi:hypothetical protein
VKEGVMLNLVRMVVAVYIPYIYRNLVGDIVMGADDRL